MNISRRELLSLSGMGAAGLLLAGNEAIAQGASDNTALEQENLRLVQEFCDSWVSMDVDRISSYWADDIDFRISDDAPVTVGKAALIELSHQFLEPFTSARFELLRAHAIGNVVLHERIDYFDRADGGQNEFHVTGVIVIKNGKFVEWLDYGMPAA